MSEYSKQENVLITGANRGIGLELSRQLCGKGRHVIAACRTSSPQLADIGAEVIDGVDVSDAQDVERLARRLDGRRLDWLINNAGILARESLDEMDFESIERQFRVNTLGPLRVTTALLQNLERGSRVFVISSAMGSISDNSSGGYYGYRISKAGVNMAFKSLSVDLRERGVVVRVLHPGFVATDMTNGRGDVPVEESAKGLIKRMTEADLSSTGGFYHARGHQLDW